MLAANASELSQPLVRIETDAPIPSLNLLYGRHWSAKHKVRKEWGWRIKAALLAIQSDSERNCGLLKLRGHVMVGGRVAVRVETWRARRLDERNLHGGWKGAEDQLKAEGLIVDDHPKWIDSTIVQHAGRPFRTVIELWAI